MKFEFVNLCCLIVPHVQYNKIEETLHIDSAKLLGKDSRFITAAIDKFSPLRLTTDTCDMLEDTFSSFTFAVRTDKGGNTIPAVRDELTPESKIGFERVVPCLLRQWDSCESHNTMKIICNSVHRNTAANPFYACKPRLAPDDR